MWRAYNLDYLLFKYYHNFVICITNIISKYLFPNILAMLITLVIVFTIGFIRSNIKSKFFSSLFTIILIFGEIFLLVLFTKLFGVYSLAFSFITIVVVVIEIFKEL